MVLYQVAYVVVTMADSPRPGVWALEKSLVNFCLFIIILIITLYMREFLKVETTPSSRNLTYWEWSLIIFDQGL